MSTLNETPKGERIHISIFGRRNVGKSSLINAMTEQEVSIVSEVMGTTTDPVGKAMELLPLGPVYITDTPGLDDEGTLGKMRVQRAYEILEKTDIAILVTDTATGFGTVEQSLLKLAREKKIQIFVVFNKTDLSPLTEEALKQIAEQALAPVFQVSSVTGDGIETLKLALAKAIPDETDSIRLVGDLLSSGDFVVLVTPIDSAAPKGRIILPQQQTIRDILEAGAIAIVTKETEFRETLAQLGKKPRLVITDSQAFAQVAAETPQDIPLTSFSILFARYKGDLTTLVNGAQAIDSLKDGDRILIAEGCTHHRQTDDIGTVKIPNWLRKYTGKQLTFEHTAGMKYPSNLSDYALVVHCGGCILNQREMQYRLQQAGAASVPIVNYGVLIATVQGILTRCLEPFTL